MKKKINKKNKNTGSLNTYQYGGNMFDWIEGINSQWSSYMKNPYSQESTDYFNDLLNRNQSSIDQYNYTNSLYNVGENTNWDRDKADYFEHAYNNARQTNQNLPAWYSLSKNAKNAYEADKLNTQQLNKDRGVMGSQMLESGVGAMNLLDSQKAYDARKPENYNLTNNNNMGIKRYQMGGGLLGGLVPSSPLGLYKYPNAKAVNVPTPDAMGSITMAGINKPVMAYPNVGLPKLMKPGMNYQFPGATNVMEVPQAQYGANIAQMVQQVANPMLQRGDLNLTSGSKQAVKKIDPVAGPDRAVYEESLKAAQQIAMEKEALTKKAYLDNMGIKFDTDEKGNQIMKNQSGSYLGRATEGNINSLLKTINESRQVNPVQSLLPQRIVDLSKYISTTKTTRSKSDPKSYKSKYKNGTMFENSGSVKMMQKRLNDEFGANLKVDGKWGANTENAYNKYLNKNNYLLSNNNSRLISEKDEQWFPIEKGSAADRWNTFAATDEYQNANWFEQLGMKAERDPLGLFQTGLSAAIPVPPVLQGIRGIKYAGKLGKTKIFEAAGKYYDEAGKIVTKGLDKIKGVKEKTKDFVKIGEDITTQERKRIVNGEYNAAGRYIDNITGRFKKDPGLIDTRGGLQKIIHSFKERGIVLPKFAKDAIEKTGKLTRAQYDKLRPKQKNVYDRIIEDISKEKGIGKKLSAEADLLFNSGMYKYGGYSPESEQQRLLDHYMSQLTNNQ